MSTDDLRVNPMSPASESSKIDNAEEEKEIDNALEGSKETTIAFSPINTKKIGIDSYRQRSNNAKKKKKMNQIIGIDVGQKVWRSPSSKEADIPISYSELYLTLKSHAKVREAIRENLLNREHQVIEEKEGDIIKHKNEKEQIYFENHIEASSGTNTSYSPFLKRPALAMTPLRLERAAKKKAQEKDPRTKIARDVRHRMFRAMQTNILDLRNMDLTYIPSSAWSTLLLQAALVTQISLSRNRIDMIEEDHIPNMRPATFIDLTRNKLATLPENFGGRILCNLKILHIDFNPLSFLPDAFMTIETLEKWDINDTTIGALPDDFRLMKSLKYLSACRSNLSRLPGSLHLAKKLEYLDVSGNKIISFAISPRIEKEKKKEKVISTKDEDWVEVVDKKSGVVMFYNKVTKICVRHLPPKLDDELEQDPWAMDNVLKNGWLECYDMDSSCDYYFNTITNESKWEIPQDAFSDDEDVKIDKKRKIVPILRTKTQEELKLKLQQHKKKNVNRNVIEAKKKFLAKRNMGKYDALLDEASDCVYYRDNFTSETRWDMPAEVNHIGELVNLKILKANRNSLRDIPQSISQLVNLVILALDYNFLTTLPDSISQLKKLEELHCSNNRIKFIPETIGKCSRLRKVAFNMNKLKDVPDTLGNLKELEQLWLMDNLLTKLPGELGFIETLFEITVQGNYGLKSPPLVVMTKPIAQVLWHLRQEKWLERRGKPPPIKQIHVGVQEEVHLPDITRENYIDEAVGGGENSKVVNLHWKGLESIPPKFLAMSSLVELRLVGNNIKEIPESLCTMLNNLEILSLHGNKLTFLPKSIGDMKSLRVLNLDENLLETLHLHICRIRNLEELSVCNNKLKELPDEFYFLKSLKKLIVSNNFITSIPDKIGGCKRLEHIQFNYNKVQNIPDSIGDLLSLKYLSLCVNEIQAIPDTFRELKSLKTFRISQNKINIFPESLADGPLQKSLVHLWMDRNNLKELSKNFCNLVYLDDSRFDLNPMRSPPQELFHFGAKRILKYTTERLNRIKELASNIPIAFEKRKNAMIEELEIASENFEDIAFELCEDIIDAMTVPDFDENSLTPFVKNCLKGNTGNLTVDDLTNLDKRIDLYVNSSFYRYKTRGQEIIDDLLALYIRRERDHDYQLLSKLIEALEVTDEEEACDNANFITEVYRPWGRNNRPTECFVISLDGFYNDTEDLESVVTTLRRDFDVDFPYTRREVETTIARFKDPYGICGLAAEPVEFSECDCVDEDGDPIENTHKPFCKKPAAIVKKLIYSDEEAKRRADEESEIERRTEEYYQDALMWMSSTKKGQYIWQNEMNRSRRDAKLAVSKAKKKAEDNQKELVEKMETLKEIGERRKHFNAKRGKVIKKILEDEEGDGEGESEEDKDYKEGENKLAEVKHDQETLDKELREALIFSKFTTTQHEDRLKAKVRDRVMVTAIMEITQEGREKAYKNKLRRMWDGKLGDDYKRWVIKKEDALLHPPPPVVDLPSQDSDDDDDEKPKKENEPLIKKGYAPTGDSDEEDEKMNRKKTKKFHFHDEDSEEDVPSNLDKARDLLFQYTG